MSLGAVELKLELLSKGVAYGAGFLERYGSETKSIEKRRAYGSGDASVIHARVPQEAMLGDGIISALNHSHTSPWALEYYEEVPVVRRGADYHRISFPARPSFYGQSLSNGLAWERIATVYGDRTVGIFTPGHCYYFNDGLECRFCSLGPARKTVSDHLLAITPNLAAECVEVAAKAEPNRYRHALINGGNIRNYDRGFEKQLAVYRAIVELDRPPAMETHLISMPPRNHDLFEEFGALGGTLAMSLEVFDPEYFARICPGKDRNYGRDHFLQAYRRAVAAVGHGNVYAGLIAGLEPLASILEALEYFGELGVVPAVAVFHPDDQSQFVNHPRPSVEFLAEVGAAMARVYKRHGFRAFITDSGRNSLDTEAYRQCF